MIDLATKMWGMGFSLIPIHHPSMPLPVERRTGLAISPNKAGKVACLGGFTFPWGRYGRSRPPLSLVKAWLLSGYNLGVVCGSVSNCLVVDIDTQDPLVLTMVVERCGIPALSVATANGHHCYYSHPQHLFLNSRLPGVGDIRTTGGYVVGPGSLHRTGVTYTPSFRHDVLGPINVDGLTSLLPSITPIQPNKCDASRLNRALAWVAKIPPLTSKKAGGGGRNDQFYRVAVRCVNDWSLSFDESLYVLDSLNRRCSPALSAREIHRLLSNAQRYGRGS